MQDLIRGLEARIEQVKRFRTPIVVGAVLFLVASITLLYFILNDQFRQTPDAQLPTDEIVATSTQAYAPRYLDGVLVPRGEEALRPIAVMVENHVDARPWSGLDKANVVFEAPVEGGITRFMAVFDSSSTVDEIGPVRSARPYYVDWASGYKAAYAHVGGSPDALDKIKTLSANTLYDINEMANGWSFWRDNRRYAPHNAYTSIENLYANMSKKDATSTQAVKSWSFQDEATTTDRGDSGSAVSIPYGGSYNVLWKYDQEQNRYIRQSRNTAATTRDGHWIEAKNIIVILTDAKTLDDVGRLEVRTVGSGDATMYRDGKQYLIRWKRSPGEPLKFEGRDGADVLLNRGTTRVEVTTDSRIYAGLGV
mgnify:CR=1 FL=1